MSFDYDEQESGGRGRFDQTSDFSTTTISKDGRFLGIKLSQEMASQLRQFYPALLDWGRRKGEEITTPAAKKFATKILGATEERAIHFAGKTSNIVGYSVILSNQLFDIGSNVYDSTQSLNELRQAVKPLSRTGAASSVAPLSGDNEVVANARTKIKDLFWKRLAQTASGAIAVAPALYSKITEQRIRNKERDENLEIDRLLASKDEKAIDEYFNKHALSEVRVGSAKLDTQTLEGIIERRRLKYLKEFEDFTERNEKAVAETLHNEVLLTPENIKTRLGKLTNYGVSSYYIDNVRRELHKPNADVKKIISEINSTIKDDLELKIDERLRAKFVAQHSQGAFDGEWARYLPDSDRRKPTIKDSIVQKLTKNNKNSLEDDLYNNKHGHSEHSSDLGKMAAGLGAGLAAEVLTKKLVGKQLEKYNQPIALDRILHLRRVLEQSKSNPPEQVPNIGGNGELSYTRYVHEIFQQHQRDLGRAEIGERYTENLDKVRWDDSAILQLPDEQLSAYEHAVKTIAKRIKDGRMDAIALIDLVGDLHKKIVRSDGHSFGPLGIGKDDAVVKAAINKIIDEKTALLRADQKQTDAEFNEKLGDFVFSIGDIKQALESKDMDPTHRAFIFAVFSEVVGSDEQITKKLKINKDRVDGLRKEINTQFTDMLDAAVKTLAEMLEKDPEGLKKLLKVTEKEQQLIASLAEQVINNGKHVADITENRDDRKAIETVVANAAMVLDKGQDNKPEGFWQKLVSATRELAKSKAEKVDNKAPETGSDKLETVKSESSVEPTEDMNENSATEGFASRERKHAAEASRFKQDDEYRHRHKNGKGSASPEAQQVL